MKTALRTLSFAIVTLVLVCAPAAKADSFSSRVEPGAVQYAGIGEYLYSNERVTLDEPSVRVPPAPLTSSTDALIGLPYLASSTNYFEIATDAQTLRDQQYALTLEDVTYLRVTGAELSSIDGDVHRDPIPTPPDPHQPLIPLSSTPEPTTLMLFGTGLAGLGRVVRRITA